MLQSTLPPFSLLALLVLSSQHLGFVTAQSTDLNPQIPSDLKQCSTVDLTWSATSNNGSSQMYYASIVSASSAGLNGTDEVVTYLTRLNDTTSYEWQVGVRAGSNISLRVSDSAGNLGYSSPVTVQDGDSSCLPTLQNDDDTVTNTPASASTTSQSTGAAVSTMLGDHRIPKILAAFILGCAITSIASL